MPFEDSVFVPGENKVFVVHNGITFVAHVQVKLAIPDLTIEQLNWPAFESMAFKALFCLVLVKNVHPNPQHCSWCSSVWLRC